MCLIAGTDVYGVESLGYVTEEILKWLMGKVSNKICFYFHQLKYPVLSFCQYNKFLMIYTALVLCKIYLSLVKKACIAYFISDSCLVSVHVVMLNIFLSL